MNKEIYLHWPLSSIVYSEMLVGQGLKVLDLERHRTQGKLRANDHQQMSQLGKL